MTILELDVYISIDRGPYFFSHSTKYGNAARMLLKKTKEFLSFSQKVETRKKNHAELALPTKINLNFVPG